MIVQTLACTSRILSLIQQQLIFVFDRYNQGASQSAHDLSGTDNTTFFGNSLSGQLIKENCGAKLSNGSFWSYPNQTGKSPRAPPVDTVR